MHEAEVIFPKIADITFPLHSLRKRVVTTGREFWAELQKLEEEEREGQASASGSAIADRSSQPPPGVAKPIDDVNEDEDSPLPKDTKPRQAKITWQRLLELGPTIGILGIYCKQCDRGIGDHSAGCRERFNKAYRGNDDKKEVTEATSSEPTVSAKPDDPPKKDISEADLEALVCEAQVLAETSQEGFHDYQEDSTTIEAMVTRLLDRSEALGNPKALEAIQKEASGLVDTGTWDLTSVPGT